MRKKISCCSSPHYLMPVTLDVCTTSSRTWNQCKTLNCSYSGCVSHNHHCVPALEPHCCDTVCTWSVALQLCGEPAASSRTPCAHFIYCLSKAVPAFISFAKQLLLTFFHAVCAARKIAFTFIAKPFNKSVISSNAYSWKKAAKKYTK